MKAKYKTLGLKKGASQEEIQEAFKQIENEKEDDTSN